MKIPFVNLIEQYKSIKTEIDFKISEVISNSDFIGGKYVEQFEVEFAKLIGVNHCISVANGTDSLYIIMKMLGINEEHEVITVSNSWISSSETISQTGAKPVFIDINPDYYSIDESLIEKKINSKTKAIIPVHLYGQACKMDVIMKIAQKYDLYVIEDCAQAHLAEFNNQIVGSFGVASSFSFYPGKNLGAYGDAGCILTNNSKLAKLFRMYSRHGGLKKHEHIIEGINSRMDNIQAAVLTTKLKYLDSWTLKRISRAKLYSKLLNELDEVKAPAIRPNSKHVFHLYVIRTKQRDKLSKFLNLNGIQTGIHYPKILPELEAYQYLNLKKIEFNISSQYQNEILSLPIFPELKDEDIIYVVEKIKEFFKI